MHYLLHHALQNLGHVLHTVWFTDILVGMLLVQITSNAVEMLGQKDVYLWIQVFLYTKPVQLCQNFDVSMIVGAQESFLFPDFSYWSLSILVQGRSCTELSLIHGILLFHVVGTCTCLVFSGLFVVVLFLNVVCKYIVSLYTKKDSLYLVLASTISPQRRAAVDSNTRNLALSASQALPKHFHPRQTWSLPL